MDKLLKEIKEQLALLNADIEKVENKAAQRRARKTTLALSKLFKEFRATSIK